MVLRLVIGEDNYLVREGVRRLLDDGPEVDTVGSAADAAELVRIVGELVPDVVLTDIRMPPTMSTDGITAALTIRAQHPGTGVVVLSQHADASYASALFAARTRSLAYLLKERVGDRDELVRALRTVSEGGSVVDRSSSTSSCPPDVGRAAHRCSYCPSVSSTCCARWPRAAPTQPSPVGCTSRSQPSASTWRRSSPSWGCRSPPASTVG